VTQCREIFNKPVDIKTKQEIVDDKIVIGIFVPEVHKTIKPIYFKRKHLPRGAYRRIGTSDLQCKEDDLRRFYQDSLLESYDLPLYPM